MDRHWTKVCLAATCMRTGRMNGREFTREIVRTVTTDLAYISILALAMVDGHAL